MPVWPPQNTGIFDFKIPGFGPRYKEADTVTPAPAAFWLKPRIPVWIDNGSPNRTTLTTGTLTFDPICAQGRSLTFVSATSPGGVVTQTGTYSFTVAFTDTSGASLTPNFINLEVVYQDEDGNLGYGYVMIAFFTGTGALSYNHVAGLSAFTGSGPVMTVNSSNTETLTTPAPFAGGSSAWASVDHWATGWFQTPIEIYPDQPAVSTLFTGGATSSLQYQTGLHLFDVTHAFAAAMFGLDTTLPKPNAYYTDIVPVTFAITGNPFSK